MSSSVELCFCFWMEWESPSIMVAAFLFMQLIGDITNECGNKRSVSRRGRWMFSQQGRSRRSTASAGSGPGLLSLSTHITPGSRARSMARSRTHAAFLSPVSKWCQNDPTFRHSLFQAFILTPSNWGLSVSVKMGRFCPWVICVPRLACGSRAHDECSDLYWFVLVVIVILKQEHRTLGENRLKRI